MQVCTRAPPQTSYPIYCTDVLCGRGAFGHPQAPGLRYYCNLCTPYSYVTCYMIGCTSVTQYCQPVSYGRCLQKNGSFYFSDLLAFLLQGLAAGHRDACIMIDNINMSGCIFPFVHYIYWHIYVTDIYIGNRFMDIVMYIEYIDTSSKEALPQPVGTLILVCPIF